MIKTMTVARPIVLLVSKEDGGMYMLCHHLEIYVLTNAAARVGIPVATAPT
jgi:hypothetical protein